MYRIGIYVLLFCFIHVAFGRQDRYNKQEVFNNNPDVSVKWKCDVPNNKVCFEVSAKVDGYVAFGWSKTHGMEQTDIAMAGFHNGHKCVKDMWAFAEELPASTPPAEASQDITDESVEKKDGWTIFKFCKYRQDMSTEGASAGDLPLECDHEYHVHWAVGEFEDNENCKIKAHTLTNRGDEHLIMCPCTTLSNTQSLAPGVELKWKKAKGMLDVEISAMTDGWVGFGFSPDGTMLNADMFTGYVTGGMVYLQDRHTMGMKVMPMMDFVSDWKLVHGSKSGGKTTIRAIRSLAGDGSFEDIKIRSTMKAIWAYGPVSGHVIGKHVAKGSQEIQVFPTPTLQDLMDRIHRLEKRTKLKQ